MPTALTGESATRQAYEEWLNELGCPDDDMAPHGRMPASYIDRYGTWLRRHDPIAFNIGFHEWVLERR